MRNQFLFHDLTSLFCRQRKKLLGILLRGSLPPCLGNDKRISLIQCGSSGRSLSPFGLGLVRGLLLFASADYDCCGNCSCECDELRHRHGCNCSQISIVHKCHHCHQYKLLFVNNCGFVNNTQGRLIPCDSRISPKSLKVLAAQLAVMAVAHRRPVQSHRIISETQ